MKYRPERKHQVCYKHHTVMRVVFMYAFFLGALFGRDTSIEGVGERGPKLKFHIRVKS